MGHPLQRHPRRRATGPSPPRRCWRASTASRPRSPTTRRCTPSTGPGAINATSDQLKTFGPQLRHSATISDQSKTQLLALIKGLGQAGAGSTQLQSGLAAAASGASRLRSGSGTAQSGAGQLHAGLAQAKAGSQTLAAGLSAALSGAGALKTGAGHALTGSRQLLQGIGLAQGPAAASLPALKLLSSATASTSHTLTPAPAQAKAAADAINAALSAIQSIPAAKSDPNYHTAVSALQQAQGAATSLSATITTAAGSASSANGLAGTIAYQAPGLVAALNMLHGGAAQLQSGLSQLRAGNAQLATGIGKLSGGGSQLTSGLGQLTAGAGALQTGLGQLTNGTGQLASGLTGGVGPAGQLTAGLGTMQAAVIKARGQIPSTKALETLERESPGIFSSGYFVLSAVAGAQPAQRTAASFTINLLRGGTAGQIIVVSEYRSSDPRSQALGTRLDQLGATFAARNNLQLAVGGPAGSLGDLTSVTQSRVALDIAILAIVMALVLGLAARAVLLPAVATLFSLLVAASTFGVLQLLFGGPDPLLGGPGYLDPMTIIGIFTIAFAITITYSALLLMRTREAYLAAAPGENAVQVGSHRDRGGRHRRRSGHDRRPHPVRHHQPAQRPRVRDRRRRRDPARHRHRPPRPAARRRSRCSDAAAGGRPGRPPPPQPPHQGAGSDAAPLPTPPRTPIGASR